MLCSTGGPAVPDMQEVDVDSLRQSEPRSVGVEHAALHALGQRGFVDKLAALGVNGVMRAAIVGNIVGRMAAPASELATRDWLQKHSALGELLELDYNAMSHMGLYRAPDLLMRHRVANEAHVFGSVQTLFSLQETVTARRIDGDAPGRVLSSQQRAHVGRGEIVAHLHHAHRSGERVSQPEK